jgi:hypothetical protein
MGIDPETVRLVAQRLNHYAPQAPFSLLYYSKLCHEVFPNEYFLFNILKETYHS